MSDILFVNACVRSLSRTRRLADRVLEHLSGSVTELDLQEDAELLPLNGGALVLRDRLIAAENFDDDMFRYAHLLQKADEVVIAAPYWDLSFPANLKTFLEAVNVSGVTFRYSEEGIPVGLCRAKRLIYVTTAGGQIFMDAFGYGYVKTLATQFWGIKKTVCFQAEGLDIIGADVEGIMEEAENKINRYFRTENGETS